MIGGLEEKALKTEWAEIGVAVFIYCLQEQSAVAQQYAIWFFCAAGPRSEKFNKRHGQKICTGQYYSNGNCCI